MKKLIVLFLSLAVLISACGEAKDTKNEPIKDSAEIDIKDSFGDEINKSVAVIPPKDGKTFIYGEQYPNFKINEQVITKDIEPKTTNLKYIWSTRGRQIFTNNESKYLVVSDMPEHVGFLYKKYNSKLRFIDKHTGITYWERNELKEGHEPIEHMKPTDINASEFSTDKQYIDITKGKVFDLTNENKNNSEIVTYINEAMDETKSIVVKINKILYSSQRKIIVNNDYHDSHKNATFNKYILIDNVLKTRTEKDYPRLLFNPQNNTYIFVEIPDKTKMNISCLNAETDEIQWAKTFYRENVQKDNLELYIWGNLMLVYYRSFSSDEFNRGKMPHKILRIDQETGDFIWETQIDDDHYNKYLQISHFITNSSSTIVIDSKNGKKYDINDPDYKNRREKYYKENNPQEYKKDDFEIDCVSNTREYYDPSYTKIQITKNNKKLTFKNNRLNYFKKDDHLFVSNIDKGKFSFVDLESLKLLWETELPELKGQIVDYFRVSQTRVYAIIEGNFLIFDKTTGRLLFEFYPTKKRVSPLWYIYARKECTVEGIYFLGSQIIFQSYTGTYCFSDEPKIVPLSVTPTYTYVDVPHLTYYPGCCSDKERSDMEALYNKTMKEYEVNPPAFTITNLNTKDVKYTFSEDKDFLKLETTEVALKPGESATIKVWVVDYEVNRMGEVRIKWNEGETSIIVETNTEGGAD